MQHLKYSSSSTISHSLPLLRRVNRQGKQTPHSTPSTYSSNYYHQQLLLLLNKYSTPKRKTQHSQTTNQQIQNPHLPFQNNKRSNILGFQKEDIIKEGQNNTPINRRIGLQQLNLNQLRLNHAKPVLPQKSIKSDKPKCEVLAQTKELKLRQVSNPSTASKHKYISISSTRVPSEEDRQSASKFSELNAHRLNQNIRLYESQHQSGAVSRRLSKKTILPQLSSDLRKITQTKQKPVQRNSSNFKTKKTALQKCQSSLVTRTGWNVQADSDIE